MKKVLIGVIVAIFLIPTISFASTVELKGGTWLMRPKKGPPIEVTKIETDQLDDGTHIIFYTTPTGKEDYIESLQIKNINDVIQMLNNDKFVQDFAKPKSKPSNTSKTAAGWEGSKVKVKKGILLCNYFTMGKALILQSAGDNESILALINQGRCRRVQNDFMATVVKDASTFTDPHLAEIMVKGDSAWAAMRDLDCCYK